MPSFERFDRRNYRTVGARDGYGQWAETYEKTVKSAMDTTLLDGIECVVWSTARRCADLACGTGRTGTWLAGKGVKVIDGVDLTPEMLELARERNVYATVRLGDVCASGLPADSYDLVTACLVDEHLPDLGPLYSEAAWIAGSEASFVVVGFHPFFMMAAGMPTHFQASNGEAIAIETHVHLLSDHAKAAQAAGWKMAEFHEQVIDERWVEIKPSWADYRDVPLSFAWVWQRNER